MLYQNQREALRAKFKEKDNFIQQLIAEKEAVQVMRMFLSLTPLPSSLFLSLCYRHS